MRVDARVRGKLDERLLQILFLDGLESLGYKVSTISTLVRMGVLNGLRWGEMCFPFIAD